MASVPKNDPLSLVIYAEEVKSRTIFTVVALICMFALAFMIGLRTRRARRKKPTFAAILVYILVFICVFLIISSAILVGFGMTTSKECHSAITLCLVLYTSAKMILCLFLLERVHIIRAPFMHRRTDDWIWAAGTLLIVSGFSAVSIICIVKSYSYVAPGNGGCHIGFPAIPAYLGLSLDAFLNAALTVVFVLLLKPLLPFKQDQDTSLDSQRSSRGETNLVRLTMGWFGLGEQKREASFWMSIKRLLLKNAVGSALIFVGTAANATLFYVKKLTLPGWLCLLVCVIDVSWGTLIVLWLTLGSDEDDCRIANSPASMVDPSCKPHASSRASTTVCETEPISNCSTLEIEEL